MKKRVCVGLMAVLSAMMIIGCGEKEDAIQQLSLEETTIKETEVTESVAETSEPETTLAVEEPETEVIEFIYVPDPEEYEVFYDGEPHEVMFYANQEATHFTKVTSVSRPDLGIKSVSFPSLFVEKEGQELGAFVNDALYLNTKEDSHKLYDYATISTIDDSEYIRFVPADGRVDIISVPTDVDPSREEVKFDDFYVRRQYGLMGNCFEKKIQEYVSQSLPTLLDEGRIVGHFLDFCIDKTILLLF